MGNKIAIKVISPEHGAMVIKYLESLGGVNNYHWSREYYYIDKRGEIDINSVIPNGYTEAFLPEENETIEHKLPEDIKTFRATAALMRLSFYKVEDEDRFVKAVRDADELIKELNK